MSPSVAGPGAATPHILWSLSTLDPGGIEMFTVQVIPRMMGRVRVTVLLTEGRGELYDELAATGVRIIEAPLRGKFHRERIIRAEKILREISPDIVHTHSISTHYLIRIAGILAGAPVILPHLHGMMEASLRPGLFRRERRLLRSTDRVLFVSEAAREEYERLVLDGEPTARSLRERLEVVHDGVDLATFSNASHDAVDALRRFYDFPQGAPVIGKIGRLHPVKNLELLIEVVARLNLWNPELRCLVVGDGPADYKEHLDALCRRRGVSGRLVFTGFRRDIPAHLKLMDVVVQTSHSEGLPRVVLEAFAAGKPVVAARIPGMDELIEHGVNGYLEPGDSPDAIAGRVRELLEDAGRRGEFSREARSRARRYDLDTYVERMLDIYGRAAGRQPGSVRRARAIFRARFRILRRI